MAEIKIGFYIEIDGNEIIHHTINHSKNQTTFNTERDLAIQIIKQLDTLYTDNDVFNRPWEDLEKLRQEDSKNLSLRVKDRLNL